MKEIIEKQIAEVRRQLTQIEEAFEFYSVIQGAGAARLSAALATKISGVQRCWTTTRSTSVATKRSSISANRTKPARKSSVHWMH